jgi:hypothetical protein
VVPANAKNFTVVAVGAMGAGPTRALPGRIWAIIPVKAGDRLWVYVGGGGKGVQGGFNGGANGGRGYDVGCRCAGYAGGGASDVRLGGEDERDRILVAGGGGGTGGSWTVSYGIGGRGGKGGGFVAGSGACGSDRGSRARCGSSPCAGSGGRGGTQTSGGAGGSAGDCFGGVAGQSGLLQAGGTGGSGYPSSFGGPGGGGGGGGMYGGGGGGSGSEYSGGRSIGGGGGGGGGSSFIERDAIAFHSWQGWRIDTSDGLVVFDW